MNFICPKCGCSYESDEAKCPYCNFTPKKQAVKDEPQKREKRTSVSGCVIVSLEVILVAWAGLSSYFGAKVAALIVLKFLLFPPLIFF